MPMALILLLSTKQATKAEHLLYFPIAKLALKTLSDLGRRDNGPGISPQNVRFLCNQSRSKDALLLLQNMHQRIDSSTYASLLQSCIKNKALSEGKLVHAHMNEIGFVPKTILQNTLVSMYTKCSSLGDARKLFDEMLKRDVCSWSVMIAAYCRHGFAEEALALFHQMRAVGVEPNQFTYAAVIPACAKLGNLKQGAKIHEDVIRSGFQSDIFVGNALVDMYAKFGSLEKARDVFAKLPERNVVAWNTMIAGYAQNRCLDEALSMFEKMPERDVVSWNTMITGYAQNGLMDEAVRVFHKIPEPNVVSWNAIIAGCAQNGYYEEALKLFQEMRAAGVKANPKTFASVFSACANLTSLEQGIEIHEEISRGRYQVDVFVENAIMDMYAKCGHIDKARELFDKMHKRIGVSWNTMIAGYSQNGQLDEAVKLFERMPRRDVFSSTSMIVGYAQNGQIDDALRLFEEMPERDVASWTAMITGYAQNGQGEKSLNIFREMKLTGLKADSKIFAVVLKVCAKMAALEQGMEIHEEIKGSGFQSDVFVANALLDMYAKCGSIEKAHNLFDKLHQKDTVSWNTMIAGYAMHGSGKAALKLFEQMQHSRIKPNHVTLVCVLSACCHAGLVDEGWQYFNCMSQYYRITPAMEHYVCVVDLLGRAGRLDEAEKVIKEMPLQPDAVVWRCLLGACRVHNKIELGEWAAKCLLELDPEDDATYVLLSNLYAAAGRWDDSENVRKMMKNRRVRKKPGSSWIVINNEVHAFIVGDW